MIVHGMCKIQGNRGGLLEELTREEAFLKGVWFAEFKSVCTADGVQKTPVG